MCLERRSLSRSDQQPQSTSPVFNQCISITSTSWITTRGNFREEDLLTKQIHGPRDSSSFLYFLWLVLFFCSWLERVCGCGSDRWSFASRRVISACVAWCVFGNTKQSGAELIAQRFLTIGSFSCAHSLNSTFPVTVFPSDLYCYRHYLIFI